ncbi:hypothetical protein JAAARDRAFT_367704 [Jaapia argillacea MUCL 33604]|uniref:Zn(2)-C6 fungal-type domain-containing protein n=1 Tax=Jaapia argillacea MUCL 33604 TaxID=933084 RepID=A0A067Q7U9_9AGAM|nr:hypothetical protein JAAARDRAFT_367704 [Jaapia argillacea MUCL 33604]
MSSRINWRIDHSDDEGHEAQDTEAGVRKRSSRACDQCRKTKSKCERSPAGGSCTNCATAGIDCTFLGPSYKRGPPKGYINAIEQRWHRVESILAAIISSEDPRAQGIVADLRMDDLARDILDSVEAGPFGASGRAKQKGDTGKEDFVVSFFSGEASRDRSRPRRQSRVSREIVSSRQEGTSLPTPTVEWQERLSSRLASSKSQAPSGSFSFSSAIFPDSTKYDRSGAPLAQRRRVSKKSTDQPSWRENHRETSDSEGSSTGSEAENSSETFGQLSLDENSEVRFHGKATLLHRLARTERRDDRIQGGIWRFPMPGIWPPIDDHAIHYHDDHEFEVEMPPLELADKLIKLYFTYVHPLFPVVNKSAFLGGYESGRQSGDFENASGSLSGPERSQTITKLLLMAIFSISARYIERDPSVPSDPGSVGCGYLCYARDILNKSYHHSRPSTCQALLLLGVREMGVGSFEAGWLYVGMGVRMAVDLGLNRDSDKWEYNGLDLFTESEKQLRKQIWWCGCLADKYSSLFLGRPGMVNENDFDTTLPQIVQSEDDDLWQPHDADSEYDPVPSRLWTCFRASASLSVIVGNILAKMYRVRSKSRSPPRSKLPELESSLDRWYIDLADSLRYDSASKRTPPPPHVLALHLQYFAAKLLLFSAFLPVDPNGSAEVISAHPADTFSLKAFDLCQGAACHISSISKFLPRPPCPPSTNLLKVNTYNEYFDMKYAPPNITRYLLSAGIMHITTLRLRPSNVQASLGFEQCMTSLKRMSTTWTSAQRSWDLLNGVRIEYEKAVSDLLHAPARNKRPASEGPVERSSDMLQRQAFGVETPRSAKSQDSSKRIMAHMLGLDVPGIEPSTSYFPGYEWWPSTTPTPPTPQPTSTSFLRGTPSPPEYPAAPESSLRHPRPVDWHQGIPEIFTFNGDPTRRGGRV